MEHIFPPEWGLLRRSRCVSSDFSFKRSDFSLDSIKQKRFCICVCVFSSHPFWTSSSLDVPAGVTQEEGHTGFLIHLLSAVRAFIFLARRIQLFLSLVDRDVDFCVLTILIVLHPLGIFSFIF